MRYSPIDDAWAARAAGQDDDALRRAAAVLCTDPAQVTTAALLAEMLGGEDVATKFIETFVNRGDLPRAVALARASGASMRAIAAVFGRGSKRLGDVAPAPPPLPPGEVAIPKDLASASGDALRALAEEALASADMESRSAAVPRLPLFSELSPPALEQLLAAFEVRVVAGGATIVAEGDEGREAFVVVRGHVRAIRGEGDDATVLAELGPGAIFGEMALVSDAPRAASVVAMEPTQLLVAERRALEKLSKKTPRIGAQLSSFCRSRMVSNLIRHSRILGAVSAADRPALMARFETRTFKKREKIVTLGQEPEGLFLIASGNVRVMGRDADGAELVIAELGPGDVVGEISLVLRRPATADVVATHPTVALELERDQFQEAIREHPTLLGELYELATKRDEEMRTVVAQETLDVEDIVLL